MYAIDKTDESQHKRGQNESNHTGTLSINGRTLPTSPGRYSQHTME